MSDLELDDIAAQLGRYGDAIEAAFGPVLDDESTLTRRIAPSGDWERLEQRNRRRWGLLAAAAVVAAVATGYITLRGDKQPTVADTSTTSTPVTSTLVTPSITPSTSAPPDSAIEGEPEHNERSLQAELAGALRLVSSDDDWVLTDVSSRSQPAGADSTSETYAFDLDDGGWALLVAGPDVMVGDGPVSLVDAPIDHSHNRSHLWATDATGITYSLMAFDAADADVRALAADVMATADDLTGLGADGALTGSRLRPAEVGQPASATFSRSFEYRFAPTRPDGTPDLARRLRIAANRQPESDLYEVVHEASGSGTVAPLGVAGGLGYVVEGDGNEALYVVAHVDGWLLTFDAAGDSGPAADDLARSLIVADADTWAAAQDRIEETRRAWIEAYEAEHGLPEVADMARLVPDPRRWQAVWAHDPTLWTVDQQVEMLMDPIYDRSEGSPPLVIDGYSSIWIPKDQAPTTGPGSGEGTAHDVVEQVVERRDDAVLIMVAVANPALLDSLEANGYGQDQPWIVWWVDREQNLFVTVQPEASWSIDDRVTALVKRAADEVDEVTEHEYRRLIEEVNIASADEFERWRRARFEGALVDGSGREVGPEGG